VLKDEGLRVKVELTADPEHKEKRPMIDRLPGPSDPKSYI